MQPNNSILYHAILLILILLISITLYMSHIAIFLDFPRNPKKTRPIQISQTMLPRQSAETAAETAFVDQNHAKFADLIRRLCGCAELYWITPTISHGFPGTLDRSPRTVESRACPFRASMTAAASRRAVSRAPSRRPGADGVPAVAQALAIHGVPGLAICEICRGYAPWQRLPARARPHAGHCRFQTTGLRFRAICRERLRGL